MYSNNDENGFCFFNHIHSLLYSDIPYFLHTIKHFHVFAQIVTKSWITQGNILQISHQIEKITFSHLALLLKLKLISHSTLGEYARISWIYNTLNICKSVFVTFFHWPVKMKYVHYIN